MIFKTDRDVAALTPRQDEWEAQDSACKGLSVRVLPSGKRMWSFRWRGKAGWRRQSLGQHPAVTLQAARALANDLIRETSQGRDPAGTARAALPFGKYVEQVWLPWAERHIKTHDKINRQLRFSVSKDAIWRTPLAELRPALLNNFMAAQRGKPGSTNRILGMIRGVVKYAVESGDLEASPVAGAKWCKTDKVPPPKYLDPATEAALLNECQARMPERMAAMVIISLQTGIRRGECLSLRVADWDRAGKRIVIRGDNTKTGQSRVVPLTPLAQATLQLWQPHSTGGEFIFGCDGKRSNYIHHQWTRLRRAAGVPATFNWHAMRSHFASRLVQMGEPLQVVSKLLGHSTTAMTERRYASLAPDNLDAAIARMGAQYNAGGLKVA